MSCSITENIYSEFAADVDFAAIVEIFVDELPDRVDSMWSLFHCGNMDGLHQMSHQLKGAFGGCGFGCLAEFAAGLERAVRDEQPRPVIEARLRQLCCQVGRLRKGERPS